MESPEIKDKLVNGVMDFQKYKYIWNAELPVPENSLYLRFQLKMTQVTDQPIMFSKQLQHNQGNFIQLSLSSGGQILVLVFNRYPQKNCLYSCDYTIGNYIDQDQFIWVGIFITPLEFKLYIENKLIKTIRKEEDTIYTNTLKQFSRVEYVINSQKENHKVLGQMKNLQVYHNLSEGQFECLKQSQQMVTCQEEEFIEGTCLNECIKNASSLYEVKIDGEGYLDFDEYTYNFKLRALDLQIPQCVSGYIKDGEGNYINYEGSIINPRFSFERRQIMNSCFYSQGQDVQICQFKYVLFVQDVIKVIFRVRSIFYNFESVTNSVKFSDRFDSQQQKLGKSNLQTQIQSGHTIYRNYQFYTQYSQSAKLIFYSSSTFQYRLDGQSYSPCNDIFAQVQVKNSDVFGYHIKFVKASIYEINVGSSKITPSYEYKTESGYLNLVFKTNKCYQNTKIYLYVYYRIYFNEHILRQSAQVEELKEQVNLNKFLAKPTVNQNDLS